MFNKNLTEADLILNQDGSIYHLNLIPEDVADIVITVGDQDRVAEISQHFDRIDLKKGKREFLTHTGWLGKTRLTVISTGIGTDNIDIVLNELDALVNIDLKTRTLKPIFKSLDIIRIGTSGALQADIALDSLLISDYAFGFDALMNYYDLESDNGESELQKAADHHFISIKTAPPYVTSADHVLLKRIGYNLPKGITATAPGFYAPQGRQLRAKPADHNFMSHLVNFNFNGNKITNLEMETAGIYAMAKLLGHKAISVNAILANRVTSKFSKQPQVVIDKAIKQVLSIF